MNDRRIGIRNRAVLGAIGVLVTIAITVGGVGAQWSGARLSELSSATHFWLTVTGLALAVAGAVLLIRMQQRERRRAREALCSAQSDFFVVLDALPEAVGFHQGRLWRWANRRLLSELGVSSNAELAGRPLRERVSLEDRERFDAAPSAEGVFHFTRPDGGEVQLEMIRGGRLQLEGGPATVSVFRNMTERRQIQAGLMITDRLASVGILAAGVAHEISNPLSFVLTNIGFALDELRAATGGAARGGLVGHESLQALEDARLGVERVRQIVRDLRTFSRHDESPSTVVDVRKVMEMSISLVWHEMRHRCQLERAFEEVPLVRCNEARLGQVFLNLLLNAAQAMPDRPASHNRIRVGLGCDGDGRAMIEIRDNGIGIQPEHLRRLFTPFFSTKPVGLGTGLGLYICHNTIRAIGGRIDVSSLPGRGTTFTVLLPPALDATSDGTTVWQPELPSRAAPDERCLSI